MRDTLIVSAFPATGKSYFYTNSKYHTCLDSDSSHFSWVKDDNGNNTKERHPNFPQNYIEHIQENIGKVDIIFISSHKQVRDALHENGIKFNLVYPSRELKDEYIERFKNRGNDENFINFISNNWDNFIDEMEAEETLSFMKYKLESGQYMRDCPFTWVEC